MYIYVDIANVRCRWDINVLSSLNLIDLEAPRKRRNFRQLINQRILIISAMLNFARSGIKDPYLPVERPSVFFPTSRVEAVPIISLISITDIAMPLCSCRCNSRSPFPLAINFCRINREKDISSVSFSYFSFAAFFLPSFIIVSFIIALFVLFHSS